MDGDKWNPINLKAPPLHVQHAALKRYSEESAYRSICPECDKGILFVSRNQKTLVITRIDRCTHCGQLVVYEDETIGGEAVEPLSPEVAEKLKEIARSGN